MYKQVDLEPDIVIRIGQKPTKSDKCPFSVLLLVPEKKNPSFWWHGYVLSALFARLNGIFTL